MMLVGMRDSETAELEHLIADLGLEARVTIVGERDDVGDLLCASDIFLLPSRREGLPGAVLEAMALRAPVVATDLTAVRAAVPDERTARLVPVDDADATAAALALVLDDVEGTRRRVDAAEARFLAEFTAERAAAQMLAFYSRALS
jgi:glycosyltransferase involved in cell wall biosynthesis